MRDSFADKVRKTMEQLGGGDTLVLDERQGLVTAEAIFDALGVALKKSKDRTRTALRDLKRSGEIESAGRGVYRWLGKKRPEPEIKIAMWKLLRARRVVTISDLRELAGASEAYAAEWLRTLAKRGIVRKIRKANPATYQLAKDTVELPDLTDNAMKLRELRKRRKEEALQSLDRAAAAIADAKAALTSMEE
jgi:DNA-binding transcriptional ArsR family regulator